MMTIDLEQIKRDRELGTPGPWRHEQPHFANGWWVVFTDPDTDGTVDESGDGGFEECTARRVARVPDLEARVLSDAERIAELEAALEAAERVADILAETIRWHDEENPNEYGVENAFLMREYFEDGDRATLAAFRSGSK